MRAQRKPDSFAGFHVWHVTSTRGHVGVGSFEVFQFGQRGPWYWWACFPGHEPDANEDPCGPFPTAEGAYLDATGD